MPHAYTVTCLPHAYTHKLLKFKSIKLFWTNMKIFIILELLLFVVASQQMREITVSFP